MCSQIGWQQMTLSHIFPPETSESNKSRCSHHLERNVIDVHTVHFLQVHNHGWGTLPKWPFILHSLIRARTEKLSSRLWCTLWCLRGCLLWGWMCVLLALLQRGMILTWWECSIKSERKKEWCQDSWQTVILPSWFCSTGMWCLLTLIKCNCTSLVILAVPFKDVPLMSWFCSTGKWYLAWKKGDSQMSHEKNRNITRWQGRIWHTVLPEMIAILTTHKYGLWGIKSLKASEMTRKLEDENISRETNHHARSDLKGSSGVPAGPWGLGALSGIRIFSLWFAKGSELAPISSSISSRSGTYWSSSDIVSPFCMTKLRSTESFVPCSVWLCVEQ